MLDPLQLTGRTATHVETVDALGCALHPQAARAVLAMRAEAARAGIDLVVASGFRDFDRQLRIWNAKCRGERPLLDRRGHPVDPAGLAGGELVDAVLVWSALPGASRHHWGTDLDVVDGVASGDPLVPANYAPGGRFERLADWLDHRAASFDLFRPYDRDRGGVQPEPWHLSFAPVARPALSALTVEALREALAAAPIERREAILARLPELHERYVLRVA